MYRLEMCLTLEEECSLVGDQVTSKVLRGIDQTSNNCSSQIGTLEQVKKRRVSTKLLLNLHCTLHHGKLLLGDFLIFTSETFDGAESFVFATLSDEPPGRFGHEE